MSENGKGEPPELNLDSLAQKRVSKSKTPRFVFKTRRYTLRKELPYKLFRDLEIETRKEADTRDIALLDSILRALLGEEQYNAFIDADPSLDDINALFDNLGPQYGIKVGES